MSLKHTFLAAAFLLPALASAQSIGTPTASSYKEPTAPGQQQARPTPGETAILGGLMIRNFTWPEQETSVPDVWWVEEDSATTAFIASIEGDVWSFEIGKATTTYTSALGEADFDYTMFGFGSKLGYTTFAKDPRSGFEVGVIWSQLTSRLWSDFENDAILSFSVDMPTLRMKYGAFVADIRIGELGFDAQFIEDESRGSIAFIPTVAIRAGARF